MSDYVKALNDSVKSVGSGGKKGNYDQAKEAIDRESATRDSEKAKFQAALQREKFSNEAASQRAGAASRQAPPPRSQQGQRGRSSGRPADRPSRYAAGRG